MAEETNLTPTQEASRRLAEAVFSNLDLRDRFEKMAKEAANRVPVPDDFAWLSVVTERSEFAAFRDLAQKLIAVPKSEIDAERGKDR